MGGVFVLGFLFVIVGARGFTEGGLLFSAKTRLTGARGRAVGAACIVFGLSGMALTYWASDAAERQRIGLLGQGIVLGAIGVILVVIARGEGGG